MDYSYEDLVEDLSLGHEVEFLYKDEKFSNIMVVMNY